MPSQASSEPHPSSDAERGSRLRWAVLAVVSLGTLMFTLDGGMMSVSYPTLVKAFGTDSSTVVWVSTALFLTTVALVLSAAWVADTLGRKRMYLIGFTIYVVALGLAVLSPNIITLILMRVAQAVGASMVQSNINAIVTHAFPRSQRGTALGLNGAAVGIGLGLGPLFGGQLLDAFGWQALFWSRVPLGVLAIALAIFVIPSDHRRSREPLRIDYAGPLLLAATATTALLALNLAGRGGVGQPVVWVLAAISPVFLFALLRVERRVPRPVIELAQFRHRVFAWAQLSQLAHYTAMGIFVFLGAFFLVDGLGFSDGKAGLVLTVLPVMRVIGGPVSGAISDRVGSRPPTMAGLAVLGSGFLLLFLRGETASLGEIVAILALAGLGSAVFDAPNVSSIMGSSRSDRLSAAAAYVTAGRQVSQSIGITLGGALYALREQALLSAGATQSHAAVTAFGDAMLAAAVICFVGIGIAFMRGRA